jgi:hypothetical protein
MSRDFGDFQTPPALVHAILALLQQQGWKWTRVLEPTCGQGNFIAGLLNQPSPPHEIHGIEIQPHYVSSARALAQNFSSGNVTIHQANIFNLHMSRYLSWQTKGPLLVIGNPPWVTNTELGTLGSTNLPQKTNLKHLPGLEALTGSANFDIAEYIWLKLIKELTHEQPTIALLCKTSVARNVLQFAVTSNLPVSNASIRRIDAKKWFDASVDACLFSMELRANEYQNHAEVYDDLFSDQPASIIKVINNHLFHLTTHSNSIMPAGSSSLTWRQGLKHDAASVVELTIDATGQLQNKLGEIVQVEADYIYPLLKGSDLAGKSNIKSRRAIIVPHKRIGDNTKQLSIIAPQLWNYLTVHQKIFTQRKSSIYKNKPPFTYFGIGDYSFAPYKVAISGMYKTPHFRAIGPLQGKPVMLDDTCYFIPCRSGEQAAFIVSLLKDPLCLEFLQTITFWDAKRPVTKKVLQRIDLLTILQRINPQDILLRAQQELATLTPQAKAIWPDRLEDLLDDNYYLSSNEVDTAQLPLIEAL